MNRTIKYAAITLTAAAALLYVGECSNNHVSQVRLKSLEGKTKTTVPVEAGVGSLRSNPVANLIASYEHAREVMVAREVDKDKGIDPNDPDSNTQRAVRGYREFQRGKTSDSLKATGPYRAIGDSIKSFE